MVKKNEVRVSDADSAKINVASRGSGLHVEIMLLRENGTFQTAAWINLTDKRAQQFLNDVARVLGLENQTAGMLDELINLIDKPSGRSKNPDKSRLTSVKRKLRKIRAEFKRNFGV